MLQIVKYSNFHGLHGKLQEVTESRRTVIVTPHPAKADALRNIWGHVPQADIVTFAKFSSQLFEKMGLPFRGPERKSRLLLRLNVFKNLLPDVKDLSFQEFKASYQLFSDLRAYLTLDEFPDEILDNFDEKTALAAQLFHRACRQQNILDEHAAIQILAEQLRQPESMTLDSTHIIFEGFTFLTPVQISLVESLSIRHQVFIPIPKMVLEEAHAFDWVKIVEDASHQIINCEMEIATEKSIHLNVYSSGNYSLVLKQLKEQSKIYQWVIPVKKLEKHHEQEIPFDDFATKSPVDILQEERERIFVQLEQRLKRISGTVAASEIVNWLQELKESILKEKKLEAMKSLAVIQIIENAIRDVEFVLENQNLDSFFLSLLNEVASLDSPRNHLISLASEELGSRVLSLRDIYLLDWQIKGCVVIDSHLGSIQSDNRAFSPEIERQLARLGPVRRPELEFLFVKASLQDVLNHPDLEIYIEQGVLEHDVGWKKIFKDKDLITKSYHITHTHTPKEIKFSKPLSFEKLQSFSASRLQDYRECPRYYYASRVEKIIPMVKQSSQVDVMELGTIEHELIAFAWERGEPWWQQGMNLQNQASLMIQEKFPALTKIDLMAATHEAALLAQSGLAQLMKIKVRLPEMKFEFAKSFKGSDGRQGEIDCLATTKELSLILDFKRSQGGNPDFKNWEKDYPKLQLWFYLNSLEASDTSLGAGYIFLKDPDESWMVVESKWREKLENVFDENVFYWSDIKNQLELYENYELNLIEKIRSDQSFEPQPFTKDSCQYCELKSICPKSAELEIEDE
jgi:hypothetical protein